MSHPFHRRFSLLSLLALLLTLGAPSAPAPAAVAATSNGVVAAPAADPSDTELVAQGEQGLFDPIQQSSFYFVMPDRFSNGDPANDTGGIPGGPLDNGFKPDDKGYYHGGDLKGLMSKLDYLKGMGVSAIWMTPMFKNKPVQDDSSDYMGKSAAYHGYWITDFTQIDPHFGTNAELQQTIAEAHARGIKVFFDIITNHTADVITYADNNYDYVEKAKAPYRDSTGKAFDDRDYAGKDTFPNLNLDSFPHKPTFATPADATVKKPDWLNNPLLYHNRGNTSFTGENALYGDFFGLDDLFTEQPQVVNGMIDIFKTWVDLGIDGYRIDTVKHVNIEFWQKFAPAIKTYAASKGNPNFFMYGEVYDQAPNSAFRSTYTTSGKLPAVLDFGFQDSARTFASKSGKTSDMQTLFDNDDYYTDADSNAYRLPTFLGNHDMGRIGNFLQTDNASATDNELLARDKLAHALMYFARGMPVVYYGDEQGFTGDAGGDKNARQDMFPSQVATYNDDTLIGTPTHTNVDHFADDAANKTGPSHPLYQAMKTLASVRAANPALWRGAQIPRYSSGDAGILAFSRIDRTEKVEYIIVLNNANTAKTATFATYQPSGATFAGLAPITADTLTANASGQVSVTLPAFGYAVYKANAALAASGAAPAPTLNAPKLDPNSGRIEVGANVAGNQMVEVTFAAKVGDAPMAAIGTDTNAPYRVFFDASAYPPGTPVTFKAIVNDLNGHLQSATLGSTVPAPIAGASCPTPKYAVVHYQRPANDYAGWGLHLFGDAYGGPTVDWGAPAPFQGEDSFGKWAYVPIKDANAELGFIIHTPSGDSIPTTREPGDSTKNNNQSIIPAKTPEVWLKQGDPTVYTSQAAAQGYFTVHYQRTDANYAGWGLYLFDKTDPALDDAEKTTWPANRPFTGTDSFGVYSTVKLKDASKTVGVIVMNNGTKDDFGDDRFVVPADTSEIWIKQGDKTLYPTLGAATNTAVIHYRRINGDYGDYSSTDFNNFWGLHVWTGALAPNPDWQHPVKPTRTDAYGQVFEVPLAAGATELDFITHRGDAKDPDGDQKLEFKTYGYEIWVLEGLKTSENKIIPLRPTHPLDCASGGSGNLKQAKAHWLTKDTLAWTVEGAGINTYKLYYDPTGAIQLNATGTISNGVAINLTFDPAGLPAALKAKYPNLAAYGMLRISDIDRAKIPDILKGQVVIAAFNPQGGLVDATTPQMYGVLDDVYSSALNAKLGVTFGGALSTAQATTAPTLRVWAPTAKSVALHLFDNSTTPVSTTVAMTGDVASGVWSAQGDASWNGKYYLYDVEVYVPSTGKVEHNLVTDPYSLSLSINSTRSQIVNLGDATLKPAGWDNLNKPKLPAPEDQVLYELHVRDFSASDATVPEVERGTFKAFTEGGSNGMKHLRSMAQAGLTTVHILPAFDCASINEDKSTWKTPDATALAAAPDSDAQQAAVKAVRDQDAFNWCYDPFHYTTPEGSYSTNPDGTTRILEFRQMVQALNQAGLRVVMDVVYNHTAASGQDAKSVLDKIVPGYYYRHNAEGVITTSSCCPDTASENAMMEKLMVDSLSTWATAYKVDGFRFDLMGFHLLSNMTKIRDTLHALTPANSGVSGSELYLYGEGWNFGEMANNARGVNATQINTAGSGIGTFNDRIRDAIRGGGPFDGGQDLKKQGFVTGLSYDPNDLSQGTADEQKARLLLNEDQIRVGLAGNLKTYKFIDRTGVLTDGAHVDYNGSPTGYTSDPQEVINYTEAHDNGTLFDAINIKAPAAVSLDDRIRMQQLGTSLIVLGQGVPFIHAGQEMLRSKSFDDNSFNSGDWFNKLDWTFGTNNFGVGLPIDEDANWPVYKPLLANSALKPSSEQIQRSAALFEEWLRIRKSSPLFRLQTADQVQEQVTFLNVGPSQKQGLIVMALSDPQDQHFNNNFKQVVVVFNANNEAQTFSDDSFKSAKLRLHPVQANSVDATVRSSSFDAATGTFTVPPRTTAVFVVGDYQVATPLIGVR